MTSYLKIDFYDVDDLSLISKHRSVLQTVQKGIVEKYLSAYDHQSVIGYWSLHRSHVRDYIMLLSELQMCADLM